MNRIYKNKRELIEILIDSSDSVLDVGFWGHGVQMHDENWVHSLLSNRAYEVYGVDIDFDVSRFTDGKRYRRCSAESFSFDTKFDAIFAGDVIEHLSNPGKFLDCCAACLKEDGRLLITTPNCFNLFNIVEKIAKGEPTVNSDHTCYYNQKTLRQLLSKNGWQAVEIDYLYSLEIPCEESFKKKIQNVVYRVLSTLTTSYVETIVCTARRTQ
jgi:2-polyprenyl-3-methyl-5-hydroxy-6-metoxy-1,4-benzoquinol methylase